MPGKNPPSLNKQQNRVRIIGGAWRGRKLDIADIPALRPTPDRIRETLFNWLQVSVPGARCLDLFAGTGALGFEAISRGANQTVFVDDNQSVINNLKQSASTLKTEAVDIIQANVSHWLKNKSSQFDIVFLDPPYRQDLVPPVCQQLEAGNWLSDSAWIFIEIEKEAGEPILPENWKIYRQASAGQSSCYLIHREK